MGGKGARGEAGTTGLVRWDTFELVARRQRGRGRGKGSCRWSVPAGIFFGFRGMESVEWSEYSSTAI